MHGFALSNKMLKKKDNTRSELGSEKITEYLFADAIYFEVLQ